MDYPRQQRLKIFGHARVIAAADEPELAARLADPYDAVVERAMLVSVDVFDWNCRQHIIPRYTLAELEPFIAPLRDQLSVLAAENAELRRQLDHGP